MLPEILDVPWVVWPCERYVILGDCCGSDPLPPTLHLKKDHSREREMEEH